MPRWFAIAGLSLTLCVGVAVADPDSGAREADERAALHGVLSIQFENDWFAGQDRNYTHGTRIAYVTPQLAADHWGYRVARRLAWLGLDGPLRHTYTVGQSIFTPDDISRREPILTDQPYAGYLYLGLALESEHVEANSRRLDTLELQAGVVGPLSGGEAVQKWWHATFGFDPPRGWDNQLRNEPTLNLRYERTWGAMLRFPRLDRDGDERGPRLDISPRIGGAVGSVYTYAAGGVMARWGRDLPDDYGPPLISPTLGGSQFFKRRSDLGWYLYAGVGGRAVARNLFLDGNTFVDSRSVDRNLLVGEAQFGIVFTVGRYRMTYCQALRTSEFGDERPESYGSLNVGVSF